MTRISAVLCSVLALLTFPAHAGSVRAAIALPAPRASSAPDASARPDSDQNLAAEVLILHATNEKKGIDPRIGALPELAKAPFSNYDSYRVLDRVRLPLKKDAPTSSCPTAARWKCC